MQTITIAVSAILIAAGLVTAPGLIKNARDNNAKTDLANIAYAQEFALSTTGDYEPYINEIDEEAATGNDTTGNNLSTKVSGNIDEGAIKFSLSGQVTGHAASICKDPDFFIVKDRSSTSTWFYRGSVSAVTSDDINDIEIPLEVIAACPDIIDGFEETGGTLPPVTPNPYATQCSDPNAEWTFADPDVRDRMIYHLLDDGFTPSVPLAVGDAVNITNLYFNDPMYDDLDGIQCATNVTHFTSNYGSISDFDPLNSLPVLRSINVTDNAVDSVLELSGVTQLSNLNARDNRNFTLSVSGSPLLTSIYTTGNTTLDFRLDAMDGLTSLDVAGNGAIDDISFVDLPELRNINFDSNTSIGNMTISNLPALTNFRAQNNPTVGNVVVSNSFNAPMSPTLDIIGSSVSVGNVYLENVSTGYSHVRDNKRVGTITTVNGANQGINISNNERIGVVDLRDGTASNVNISDNDSIENIFIRDMQSLSSLSIDNRDTSTAATDSITITDVRNLNSFSVSTPSVSTISLFGMTGITGVILDGSTGLVLLTGITGGAPNLEWINISNTSFTNLNALLSVHTLTSVRVSPSFPQAAIDSFVASRPSVEVYND